MKMINHLMSLQDLEMKSNNKNNNSLYMAISSMVIYNKYKIKIIQINN